MAKAPKSKTKAKSSKKSSSANDDPLQEVVDYVLGSEASDRSLYQDTVYWFVNKDYHVVVLDTNFERRLEVRVQMNHLS
eukprot:scaffold394_cov161-Chaetoceros_neogracile.AAC.9